MSVGDRELRDRLYAGDVLLAVRQLRGFLCDPVPECVHFALRRQPEDLASGLTTLALAFLNAEGDPETAARMLERLETTLEARLMAEAEMDLAAQEFRWAIDAAEREAADAEWVATAGPDDIQWVEETDGHPGG